ncbi:general secretion pathway protein E [Corallococcus macrosporus]|uniref:General secretion pathway protein E n=1 Tax=Myxococcus fulvus (strain ATCC BAA-855 / HW-1) TaxID=483219 RepID=F8CJZ7_MYXFH|nr:general secretion pathway protein E [Corallococcus macrosporus]
MDAAPPTDAVSPSDQVPATVSASAESPPPADDAPPEAAQAAAQATTPETAPPVTQGKKDEWATLTFAEVTTPFGLKLDPDEADLADEEAPSSSTQAEPPATDSQPEAPGEPRKGRGFVVAEHGELLTTPVPTTAAQDGAAPEAHGDLPAPFTEASEVTSPPVAPTPRAPIELDDLSGTSDEPMQLASTWEFVGWQGGSDAGPIGHAPETTWADRVVDLEGPAPAPASSAVPLATAWDFIQQPWQSTASEPSELIATLLAAAAGASTDTAGSGPSVTAEQVLTALDAVSTQGTLGRVVLAYCAGRFQRAFLLGESLGLARVGHAWGPGSDTAEVSGLKVDLEAPSLLHTAMASPCASVFAAPACPQDEAIFAALGGEGTAHLAVIAIRNRGQAVAFIVADHGAEPVGQAALDELALIAEKASASFARLPTRGA